MEDPQNWRLKATPATTGSRDALESLVRRVRHGDAGNEPAGGLPHDVAVTHDGQTVFAYATSEDALNAARASIEADLQRAGATASIVVSHWSDEFDRWLQVDPPLVGQAEQQEVAAERDAETPETRTLIASAGRGVRTEIEETMRESARTLNLELTITEHPHLLTCQVLFEVTGARRKLDEFAAGLNEMELATMRTERTVMTSPL
jgi:hypothetical protein